MEASEMQAGVVLVLEEVVQVALIMQGLQEANRPGSPEVRAVAAQGSSAV
jgi:hypothetical protein